MAHFPLVYLRFLFFLAFFDTTMNFFSNIQYHKSHAFFVITLCIFLAYKIHTLTFKKRMREKKVRLDSVIPASAAYFLGSCYCYLYGIN